MNRDNIQTRSSEFTNSGRVVEGYAIVFNSWSEVLYGEFRELILPTAIDMSTVNASDIFATLDHDRRRPLARRRNGSGTLDISIDDQGLKYRFELADTQV
jgi:HK97 family phage prohead protease